MSTNFRNQYYAYELTKQSLASSADRLSQF